METSVTHYANGPLPEHLAPAAYFTGDRREWALPKSEALAYIDWCEREHLEVLGFEVWYPTTPGPTVLEFGVGNVEGIAAAREGLQNHPGRYPSGPVVFNITVADREPTPRAG